MTGVDWVKGFMYIVLASEGVGAESMVVGDE